MSPEIQTVVRTTQAWLRSSWHIQVPFAWLEACVEWLQEEAGGAGRLSQQQINQQALDQWMLTDLRDLNHPVLPEGLAQAQKIELSGTFCVQVDSLLDVSQPAYGQLQKWKGTDCVNEEVSAVTQATQRPWEARPMRMLLMQVTDGVQSLEAMEYRSIPALSSALKPGVKLQLQGQMVCRLGVLLLGPANVKILGGEVEDLVERNNQGRVLCRTLGLPEEQQQQQQQEEEEETQPAPEQGNQEVDDLELDDAELLASLDQQEVERVPVWQGRDSGYGTHNETSTQSSRSSSVRSLVSTASYRSEASGRSHVNRLTQGNRGGSVQGSHHSNEQEDPDLFDLLPPDHVHQQGIADCSMADEDFANDDFDDLPLDELDGVMLQASANVPEQENRSTGNTDGANNPQTSSTLNNSRSTAQKRDYRGCPRGAEDDIDFMDEDLDCFMVEEEAQRAPPTGQNRLSVPQGPCKKDTLTLTSPPFTYLSLLDDMMSKPNPQPKEIHVKAFIVTLLGKLSSSSGLWCICATISDGTGYLDVEMSDGVLTGLLGFSVAEKATLKRDPARKGELDAGMRRCQEELVDMCCVMTVMVQPEGRKAVVTKAEPVSEKVLGELEQRVRDGRK